MKNIFCEGFTLPVKDWVSVCVYFLPLSPSFSLSLALHTVDFRILEFFYHTQMQSQLLARAESCLLCLMQYHTIYTNTSKVRRQRATGYGLAMFRFRSMVHTEEEVCVCVSDDQKTVRLYRFYFSYDEPTKHTQCERDI